MLCFVTASQSFITLAKFTQTKPQNYVFSFLKSKKKKKKANICVQWRFWCCQFWFYSYRFTHCRCWEGSQTGPPGQPGEVASGSLCPALLHTASWQNHRLRLPAVKTHMQAHIWVTSPVCCHTRISRWNSPEASQLYSSNNVWVVIVIVRNCLSVVMLPLLL